MNPHQSCDIMARQDRRKHTSISCFRFRRARSHYSHGYRDDGSAQNGNVNVTSGEDTIYDDFIDSQDDIHELTGLMSVVYDSTSTVIGTDANNRRSDHVDGSSMDHHEVKTRTRRCWSLRDEYTLLNLPDPPLHPRTTDDIDQKVHMAPRSTVSEFASEIKEENHGTKSDGKCPWKLEHIHDAKDQFYPEEEEEEVDGHGTEIQSSGRHYSKFQLLHEKQGVLGYLIRCKKRVTERLMNRYVSKSKSRSSDQGEEGSPLKLGAGAGIRSHKWQPMIRKRITSSSWQEFNHAANEYYISAGDEEILSMAMDTYRATSKGKINQDITRSAETNSQEHYETLGSDSDQQGRAMARGSIVPYIISSNYNNNNNNNNAVSLTCASASSSNSRSVDVLNERDAMEALKLKREKHSQIKKDEIFDMKIDRGLGRTERSVRTRRSLVWPKKKGRKWKYNVDTISEKTRDHLAGTDEKVITSHHDNNKTIRKEKYHSSLNIKQNSEVVYSEYIDHGEEGDLKLKKKIKEVKSLDIPTEGQRWLLWTCLASAHILQEFQEAVENAHLQMRMLSGFIAIQKDTEIMASYNICTDVIHHYHRSNVTSSGTLEDTRNHVFANIMEAGIQMSGSLISFQRPWHIKYALDACVNSIFFKLNLHRFSEENSTNNCAEYRIISQSSSSSSSSSPLTAKSSFLEYNPRQGFECFLTSRRKATEELIGTEMEKWSEPLKSIFLACAVSCFHVYTLIAASGSRMDSVKTIHPLHGDLFDETTMDPLDSGYNISSSTRSHIELHSHRCPPKVLFTIFSGFALHYANDEEEKILCKPQVYITSKPLRRTTTRIGMASGYPFIRHG